MIPKKIIQDRNDLIDRMRQRDSVMTYAEACNRNAFELPDRVAVADRRHRFTWGQVKQISDRLALALLERGVMRPDTVLVHLRNTAEQFVIRLACEKAGVRVVLTSTWFREADLLPITEMTRPKIAFVSADIAEAGEYDSLRQSLAEKGIAPDFVVIGGVDGAGVPWAGSYVEFLDTAPAGGDCDGLLDRTRFRCDDRFYLPTTSGSTSAPKISDMIFGLRINLSLAHAAGADLAVGETVAALSPITSGTADSLIHHAAPYFAAGTVLEPKFDAVETCSFLAEQEVNVAVVVPTMLTRMLATGAIDRLRDSPFRCFVSYASAISYEIACAVEDRARCKIVCCYGTMDYGGISMTTCSDDREIRLKSVGKPLPGNDVRIVDENGDDVPPGASGEVIIRPGRYSSGGYYRDPERTRQAWSGAYYRLGDVAEFDLAGNLWLAGRNDDLIIRGGQNIVPAEVEELVAIHPAVVDVIVIGVPDKELGERVCACVILEPGEELGVDDIRTQFDALGVARFKCPERIAVVAEFPMAMSGMKVDRRRLRESVTSG